MIKKHLFLDDNLIIGRTANEETLERAHRIVLDHLDEGGRDDITYGRLETAYKNIHPEYSENNLGLLTEWDLSEIVEEILISLEAPEKFIPEVLKSYSLHAHDYFPKDNVLGVLPKLREQRELHLIANSPNKKSLDSELDSYNLTQYFKTITLSREVGYRKPHPAIYQEAMRRANITPGQSIFLSHNEGEVRGAKDVGMNGIIANTIEEVYAKDLAGILG